LPGPEGIYLPPLYFSKIDLPKPYRSAFQTEARCSHIIICYDAVSSMGPAPESIGPARAWSVPFTMWFLTPPQRLAPSLQIRLERIGRIQHLVLTADGNRLLALRNARLDSSALVPISSFAGSRSDCRAHRQDSTLARGLPRPTRRDQGHCRAATHVPAPGDRLGRDCGSQARPEAERVEV